MSGVELVSAVGLEGPAGDPLIAHYREIMSWEDTSPEKHELVAHLLVLALKYEWQTIERLRKVRADHQRRLERRAAREAKKK